jgi:hypothetical protein
MADKRMRYQVDVDADDAVRGMRDFAKAADKANADVKAAFDDSSSAADKASAAILGMANVVDAAMRESAAAADALSTALGPELTGRMSIDEVVADLNRMGLSFDEIRADADKLATTLRQVDDIKLRGMADGLDYSGRSMTDLRDRSDQTRSVMANMAGNVAQDLGTLGGAVGSLGVGIGQLAEYAAEGNISLGQLGQLAGPLAALTAVGVGVQFVTQGLADLKKAQQDYTAQFTDFAATVEQTGSMAEAVGELIEKNTLLAGRPQLSWWQSMMNDLPLLNNMVTELSDETTTLVEAMAHAGITQEEWFDAMRVDLPGGIERYNALTAELQHLADTGQITTDEFELLNEQFVRQGHVVAVTASQTETAATTMATSLAGINEMLDRLSIAEEPLKTLPELWRALIRDVADGTFDFENAAAAVDQLAEATGMSAEDVIALAKAEADAKVETKELADISGIAAEAMQAAADAANAQADGLERIAELQSEAAEADRAAVDAVYAQEQAIEDFNDANADYAASVAESGEASVESTRKMRDARDAAIDLADAHVDLVREQAKSNQETFDAVDAIDAENAALVDVASQLSGPTRQAVLDHIAAVNDIPADVETEIATLIEQGKYDEALALIAEVSGRRDLEVHANLNKASAATVRSQADALAAGKTLPIEATLRKEPSWDAKMSDVTAPVTKPVNAVVYYRRRSGGGAGGAEPVIAAPGALRVAPAAAAPAAATVLAPQVVINTAVIGNRFDVMRAVTDATRSATRIAGRRLAAVS